MSNARRRLCAICVLVVVPNRPALVEARSAPRRSVSDCAASGLRRPLVAWRLKSVPETSSSTKSGAYGTSTTRIRVVRRLRGHRSPTRPLSGLTLSAHGRLLGAHSYRASASSQPRLLRIRRARRGVGQASPTLSTLNSTVPRVRRVPGAQSTRRARVQGLSRDAMARFLPDTWRRTCSGTPSVS